MRSLASFYTQRRNKHYVNFGSGRWKNRRTENMENKEKPGIVQFDVGDKKTKIYQDGKFVREFKMPNTHKRGE
jgi:hypothetical protein